MHEILKTVELIGNNLPQPATTMFSATKSDEGIARGKHTGATGTF